MSGTIGIDVSTLEGSDGCDLVGEALGFLEVGESLHLTLDRPPDCAHEAVRRSASEEAFALKLVDRDEGTWKMRVRRVLHPCRCHDGRSS